MIQMLMSKQSDNFLKKFHLKTQVIKLELFFYWSLSFIF